MKNPKTIPEVLRAAADKIEACGSHKIGDGSRGLCAGLAIRAAIDGDVDGIEWEACDALARHLGLSTEGMKPIYQWSDAQPDATTVVAALRSAAAEMEESAL